MKANMFRMLICQEEGGCLTIVIHEIIVFLLHIQGTSTELNQL